MASKTEACNLALGHVGISKEIQNVDTEASAEASACRRYLPQSIDEIARDFNFPFMTMYATLGLVEENPNDDWAYSYRYPSDCSRIRRILSGVRNDTRQSKISYKIAKDDTGILILTDQVNAQVEYTSKIVDISIMPADAVSMLSLLLASYIAPRITAGDPFKLGERAFRLYILSKAKCEATAFNEQQDDENPEAESIRSRE